MAGTFNIAVVAQSGRLSYETLLLLASLRHSDPGFKGQVFVCIPEAGELWRRDPGVTDPAILELFQHYGGTVLPFRNKHFGSTYPHGNKIECLTALPKDEPFLFLDSDTLVTGALSKAKIDFKRPTASMNRGPSWPKPDLYHADYADIWGALYARFGLDFASSLDERFGPDDWQRYLYFNAGWFLGPCPVAFGTRFAEYAVEVRDHTPYELVSQSLDPWLDQIVLPLVVHSFGGGRPEGDAARLDGELTRHWRALPLLHAAGDTATVDLMREVASFNKLKKVLRSYKPFKDQIWRGDGEKVRALFPGGIDRMSERIVRNRIKAAGLWAR